MMWTGPGSRVLTTDTVTRSAAGRVTDQAFDGAIGGTGDANTGGANYTYDGAARSTRYPAICRCRLSRKCWWSFRVSDVGEQLGEEFGALGLVAVGLRCEPATRWVS